MVCETLASIADEEEFYQKLRLSHLFGKKGVFTLKFGLSCQGTILSTEVIANKSNATREDLLNIFSNQIQFRAAMHNGITVDSYYVRNFRIRNDWIKLIK